MEIKTHVIPIMTFSTNPVEFLQAKQKAKAGKEIINESTIIVPQYIIQHPVLNKPGGIMSPGKPTAALMEAQHIFYYSWYGEQKCTESEFKEWELKHKPKKD